MKFFSMLALVAIIAQCADAHQMLRSASTKSVDFSVLSGEGSNSVGSMKHKRHDGSFDGSWGGRPPHPKGSFDGKMMAGSFDGSWGGRRHGPHHPKGSFDGSFDGHHKWAGSFDGSFPGPHGKGHGKGHGSFEGHGKDIPFPGKGKKGKKPTGSGSEEATKQQSTEQQTASGSD
ncbi:hypothetical protein KRP22_013597 [Phytophthora ramorum]|nr:hypothetical protein KRP22_11225 [Phytophthora ramorum]